MLLYIVVCELYFLNLLFTVSQLLLASGGDDNAVTVYLLEISDSGLKELTKVSKDDAHAAQVTGTTH